VSLWREEARLAESVVELVAQLEESWGGLMDTLDQEQVGLPVCGGCWMGGVDGEPWGGRGWAAGVRKKRVRAREGAWNAGRYLSMHS
jgi:hypothetical protein